MSLLGNNNNIIAKLLGNGSRPPFEAAYIYILAGLLGYATADLGNLHYRPTFLPQEAPPPKPAKKNRNRLKNMTDYASIANRNIFNADGKIPPALSANQEGSKSNIDLPPVKTQLPIQLLGTIVHVNGTSSIATLNLKNKNLTKAFKVGEEIDGIGEVLSVERKRAVFMNKRIRRKEYVEIPEDMKLSFGLQEPKQASGNSDVIQKSDFDFAMKRSDFEKYTSDLSSVLRQARMMPNTGPNGEVSGFKFVDIQKDSIFDKLGFKVGDVIMSVNDETVNSPTKAMEMYNLMKTGSGVSMGVERNGRVENFNYTIE